jgi:hypothetical protein
MKTGLERVTSEIWLTIIGLIAGSVVSIVFSRLVANPAPGISGLIGAVVFLVTQMLGLRIRVDEDTKRHREILTNLISTMSRNDAERVLVNIGLAHADQALSAQTTSAVWRQLTWYTQHNYCATNFLEPKEFFGSGDAKNTLRLQKTKLRAQPDFALKKVLIWDGIQERDSTDAREIVQLHVDDPEALMTLKGILREEIDRKPLLSNPLRDLDGQIDFAIFDDMVVLVWALDDKRRPKGGKVIVGTKQVVAFRAFFNALIQEAQPLTTRA